MATSPVGCVQLPRQESLARATEGPHHPAFLPHTLPGSRSPPKGEHCSGEAGREPDSPAALRLCLRRGGCGPARVGVGETIGKTGKGGQGRNEGRGLLTYSRFSSPF